MIHRFIFVKALLLGCTAALAGALGPAFARTPLQPEQHVYPDSTYEEIQQVIDNGGTVYFHRLTRQAGQYGEYNQIASSTPDVPANTMADARNKGFFIGRYGKDVDIIGMPGPDGERPKINGGTIAFRVGAFPRMGIVGLPVNFRLDSLELVNPDMADAPLLNSRVGIMLVSALGAQSTINNCMFTVTGKETDPGHANNHSVAIWFYLEATMQPHPPVNGARIDITNNTVIAAKVHEGIHVDNYWPETPGLTAPRAFVSTNTLHLENLGGYANKNGTNGATVATGIVVVGNLSGSIVTNNTINGDGRSPGLTPRVESVAIRVGRAGAAGTGSDDQAIANATVVGNDSSSFASDFQIWTDSIVSESTVARNSFGPASSAGVRCEGHDNWFDNNRFHGDYPGWEHSVGGPGLVCFTKTSAGNRLTKTRLNRSPDICGQVDDQSGGANMISGYDKCPNQ